MKEKLRKGEAKEPSIAQMLDSFVDELDFKQFPFKTVTCHDTMLNQIVL